jgi:hypothetical protein
LMAKETWLDAAEAVALGFAMVGTSPPSSTSGSARRRRWLTPLNRATGRDAAERRQQRGCSSGARGRTRPRPCRSATRARVPRPSCGPPPDPRGGARACVRGDRPLFAGRPAAAGAPLPRNRSQSRRGPRCTARRAGRRHAGGHRPPSATGRPSGASPEAGIARTFRPRG